jgi:hypothetical protein
MRGFDGLADASFLISSHFFLFLTNLKWSKNVDTAP